MNTEGLGLRYFVKTECSRLISCLLYDILLCFCRPIISLWALRENNALELPYQSTHYIGDNHKPYYNEEYWPSVIFVWIDLVCTAMTSCQYSPIQPLHLFSKRLILFCPFESRQLGLEGL